MRGLLCLFMLLMMTVLAGAQKPVPKAQPAPTPHPVQQTNTSPSAAQGAPAPAVRPSRIVTGTRLVSIFSRLENQFYTAVEKKDKATVTQMCEDDFSIWTPNESGDPLPIDDFLESLATEYTVKSFRIGHVAAHDLGDSVVVKFELSQSAEFKGKTESGEYFVVDAWKKEGDSWKLADRFISKFGPMQATTRAKPTGKE